MAMTEFLWLFSQAPSGTSTRGLGANADRYTRLPRGTCTLRTRCRSLGAIGTQSNSYWTLDNVLLRVQGYFYLSLSPGR